MEDRSELINKEGLPKELLPPCPQALPASERERANGLGATSSKATPERWACMVAWLVQIINKLYMKKRVRACNRKEEQFF
jgi:hypothetical protein